MEFNDTKDFVDLPIKIMSDEVKETLEKRGKVFIKFCTGTHYKYYTGNMFYMTQYGPYNFCATGRIMIDFLGHKKTDPNYHYEDTHNSTGVEVSEISSDMYSLIYPFLRGYTFEHKIWGELYPLQVEDIEFDDHAFDTLVLDKNKKKIAKALVVNIKHGFKDVIKGKSGGCIFMLHGPPGTGKTLTCESIADLLHQPLYKVTCGELGTRPEDVEYKLSEIIELSHSWNAIVLLDEADIFLEKRNIDNLTRNAIVSIFLRLLEKFDGIMFLTTNRIDSIDEAFQSRISMTFEYEKLKINERHTIWNNLLKLANVKLAESDVQQLADLELNGREIKNLIRNASALAKSNEESVTKAHIDEVYQRNDLKRNDLKKK